MRLIRVAGMVASSPLAVWPYEADRCAALVARTVHMHLSELSGPRRIAQCVTDLVIKTRNPSEYPRKQIVYLKVYDNVYPYHNLRRRPLPRYRRKSKLYKGLSVNSNP
jgi:hypothetical protein